MSAFFDSWGNLPGTLPVVETYESTFRWGPAGLGLITGGVINANAVDSGNIPTYELRPGLLLAQKTADASWTNYSATATDGSQIAAGVLLTGLRMQQILTGQTQAKFYGVLVAGPIKGSLILGLDAMARSQMSERFIFDDQLGFSGYHWFPWRGFQTKTANYQLLAGAPSTDNFVMFDNTGAAGEVDFTLPAIGPGYFFGFRVQTDQTLKVISTEGANMIAFNNNVANSVAFSTAGSRIGGVFHVYSNPAGTKWIVEDASAGANTVTVA